MTEPGQLAAHIDGDDLIIDQADDTVVFDGGVIERARAGAPGALTVDGDVATVTATNRTVRYQLADPDDGGFMVGTLQE